MKIYAYIIMYLIAVSLLSSSSIIAQNEISVIQNLNLETVPKGKISKFWVHIISTGMSQPVLIPVIVAKGIEDGPVLGMAAAIHGNELNGIPIIQTIFENIDVNTLKGTVVGIPGLNVVSIDRDRRRYVDEEDLNRKFPGKEKGNRSQQYVYKITEKLIKDFDYFVDMHTASFGRTNSLYVRGDLRNDAIAQMAKLQDCDIILDSKGPSTGDDVPTFRTLRAEAMLRGIPTITVEYGNPQVYQKEMIERGIIGITNLMSHFNMIDKKVQFFDPKPIMCQKSFWVYVDEGGLLEIPVDLKQMVKKGDLIGVLRNPFGDILKEYFAPQDGIIIGKSTNPVNMHGGRIIHLGILK